VSADPPPREPPLRGCTCAKLRRLTRRVTAVYDAELAAAGLRVTQYSLLAQLRQACEAGSPLSQLAERLDMDRTTLTRNLKPLEAAGWVRSAPSHVDGRVRSVFLTPKGEAKFQAARPLWRHAQDQVNATIGHEQIATLHAELDAYLPLFRPVPDSRDP
jgi:DNA-binding MarR family transcriptional regulator